MLWLFSFVVLGLLVVRATTRSPVGQRHAGIHPKWVMSLAARRPPRTVGHPGFEWLTWLARRCFPLLNAVVVMWGVQIFTATPHPIGVRFVDLMSVNALVAAVMLAGLPFAPRPRNGPLSLWMAWLGGICYLVTSMAFPVLVMLSSRMSGASYGTFWFPLQRWASERTAGDTVSLVATLIGVALGFLALVDGAPAVGSPATTPRDLAKAMGQPEPVQPRAAARSADLDTNEGHTSRTPAKPAGRSKRSRKGGRRRR